MTIQPKFHWQFREREGSNVPDSIGGVVGKGDKTRLDVGVGRIGESVQLSGRDSRITFGDGVGQFGARDFTVAFGMKVINNHGDTNLNIIGNRNVNGHGNWFSLRLGNRLHLVFEVDENNKGKNHVRAVSPKLEQMRDQRWHHVAMVRNGRRIALYLDGVEVADALSKTGVANINSGVEMKLGHWTRHTSTAFYEDLRIYDSALSATQVAALVPPNERPLREGEIELVAADDAALMLSENLKDLSRYSNGFERLRVGSNTGVTLFSRKGYKGVMQKLYSDIPNIQLSKLKAFPQSIKTWSSIGDPFTGGWVVLLPDGRFLGDGRDRLVANTKRFSSTYFKFHYNLQFDRIQLVGALDHSYGPLRLEAGGESFVLFVDLTAGSENQFAIQNSVGQWLAFAPGERPFPPFRWLDAESDRLLLRRGTKFASHEGEVGELLAGEVALYEHVMYAGRAWVLLAGADSGVFPDLGDFSGLQDKTSSIRLGPNTGATLFRHSLFQVTEESQREEEIEDIFEDVPSLLESQIGNDTLSSIKIVKSLSPDEVFESVTAKLSQDYRLVDGEMEEFSAYRTILRLKPDFIGEVEVSATDFTEIEVDGTIHEIDEVTPVRLKPNEINRLMITSEADGLDTPGLKFRTDDMAANEIVVIFPNKEAQQQIVDMEEGALWNATDAKGELIVDQKAHSKAEVAAVQRTIQRVMTSVVQPDAGTKRNSNATSKFSSTEPVVDGPRVGRAWELQLKPAQDGVGAITVAGSAPNNEIKGQEIDPDTWADLVNRATLVDEDDDLLKPLIQARAVSAVEATSSLKAVKAKSRRRLGRRLGRRFRNAFNKATRVVVGVVKDVVNIIVETAEGVLKFVIDTVQKVAEFIEATVEKVVKTIKQFIEFLQFLFNWDDILKTQRYLVSAVNDALDFGVQLADNSKAHVTTFFNDIQESVVDQFDATIRAMGGVPSQAPDADDELPEALEWFVSKLFGKSQQSGTRMDSDSVGDVAEGQSPFEVFVRHLLEAAADIFSAVGSLGEGFFDAIQTLIRNPKKPQLALAELLEGLRDAIVHLVDAGENLVLATLEVVQLAVDGIKKLLNLDLHIPFISDLFRFIGGGRLTPLNVGMLLLAIPTTVIHKIMFGERPFVDDSRLELSVERAMASNGNDATTTLAFARSAQSLATGEGGDGAATRDQPANAGDAESASGGTTGAASLPNRNHVMGIGATAIAANLINGALLKPFLNRIPEVDPSSAPATSPVEILRENNPFDAVLEVLSWVFDVFVWLPTIPGVFKLQKFKDSALSSTLFVYRTFVLALDLASMVVGFLLGKVNPQRMERATPDLIVFSGVLGSIDLLIALIFFSEEFFNDPIDGGDFLTLHEFGPGAYRMAQTMRLDPSGAGTLGLVGFGIVLTLTTTVTGSFLLKREVEALDDELARRSAMA